ncbi:hypothetical protein [Hydrogenivirga sp. 128-5-R1-1]|uniref:hypothetical protein n=1 Tax=Hydrogenivirga sp. 128-5-R1-1 TaxID=392423 RepID=UPI00015F3326|nr:hypothetical protein [Hydrogenivirga sp. 128-5-R1-1]EDP74856.1 hypothetical protein HG1285_13347 [Hydrogenivirga sp. 128-5-R1-1]
MGGYNLSGVRIVELFDAFNFGASFLKSVVSAMRKALWRELSLARSWYRRDWIWGRGSKLEELRDLDKVEAE